MDEKQLETLAAQLGKRAAEQIDLDTTAQAVVRRLRAEAEPVVWWRSQRVVGTLSTAALVVLTAGVLVTTRTIRSKNEQPEIAQTPMFELESLSFSELEQVFDSLSFDRPVAELTVMGLDDLDEGQLRELLTLMEG